MEGARCHLTVPRSLSRADAGYSATACSARRSAAINRCCSAGGTDPGLVNDRRIAAANASRALPAATCAAVNGSSAPAAAMTSSWPLRAAWPVHVTRPCHRRPAHPDHPRAHQRDLRTRMMARPTRSPGHLFQTRLTAAGHHLPPGNHQPPGLTRQHTAPGNRTQRPNDKALPRRTGRTRRDLPQPPRAKPRPGRGTRPRSPSDTKPIHPLIR